MARRRSPIPRWQWHRPAGFLPSGRPATFREVVNPRARTVDDDRLTAAQRRALTLLRLERQKTIWLGTLEDGVIDKARALREVREDTLLGRALVEVELRAIGLMRKYARDSS